MYRKTHIVSILTSVRIRACDGGTMNEIIGPLIIRTREGGGSDVFDLTVRVGRHHGEDQCDHG